MTAGRRIERAFSRQSSGVPALEAVAARAAGEMPTRRTKARRREMSTGTILLIVLVLVLIGVIPTWPYSKGWGYAPSGVLGLVLLVLIVLLVMGRI